MFCIHCGKQIPDDCKFCVHCGKSRVKTVPVQAVPQPVTPPPPPPPKKSGNAKPVILGIAIALIIAIVGIGGYFAATELIIPAIEARLEEDSENSSKNGKNDKTGKDHTEETKPRPGASESTVETTAPQSGTEEAPNVTEQLELPSKKVVLSGIEADSIQYYNCAKSGNFAVIEKNGKYGIISYDGSMLLPVSYDRISPGSGYSYDFLIAAEDLDDYSEWCYVDKYGQLQVGYPDGGDVKPSSYWYDGGVVIFNAGPNMMTLEEFLEDELYGSSGLKTPGLVLDLRAWNNDHIFPVQKISGYIDHGGFQEPHIDTVQFALMDMETLELISDFVYEDIDDYNGASEGLLAVKKDGKWGFVDESGTVVIDFLYDPYERYTSYGTTYERVYTAVNGHIAVFKDGKWGLIDTQGNPVVEAVYDGISQVNPNGMFWLKENGTWTLYQLDGYEEFQPEIPPVQEVPDAYWSSDNPYKVIYENYGRDQVYFFPDSSTRLLTAADIAGMNIDELCLARNEIWARNGYLFGDDHLREYFQHFTWYHPTTAMGDQDAVDFNEIEYENIRFLRARQSKLENG